MDEQTKATIQKVAELVTPAVTDAVIGKIKDDVTVKAAIHGAPDEKQEAFKKSAEAFQKLARGEVKALSTSGSTAGAELVPTVVADQLIHTAEKVGLVRQYANRWPMSSVKENVPSASSVSAYRIVEGNKISSSTPTTGAVSLDAKTVGVLIPISKKLLLGATPALISRLTTLAGEALAKLEDQWALLGLGVGEGVFQHASVPGITMGSGDATYAKADAEDLLDVMDKIDANIIGNPSLRFVLHPTVLNVFRRLRAAVSTDKQGFLLQGFGEATPATLWDIPYSLSPVMPNTAEESQAGKKFLGLVDFNNVMYGDLKNYTFSISDQATITDTNGSTLINLFEQEMVALKVSGEIDIQLSEATKAFAWLKTAAS